MAAPRPERQPDVDLPFGREPDAPSRARRAIRRLVSDPDDPIAEAVTLTASELVTNTLHHTTDGGTMRAWDPQPDVPVRLEVEDHDSTIPAIRDVDPERPGGRGLRLVAEVSDEWGVEPTETGKVVWAEFDRSNHPPGPTSAG